MQQSSVLPTTVELSEVLSFGLEGQFLLSGFNLGGVNIGEGVELALISTQFKNWVIKEGKAYTPVIILGTGFQDDQRNLVTVGAGKETIGLRIPPPDILGPLCTKALVQKLKSLGLKKLLIMHEPIRQEDTGDSFLLCLTYRGPRLQIEAHKVDPSEALPPGLGFLYVK